MSAAALITARTAAQLAGLPGMPGTKSAVIRKAASEGWPFTEAPGVGGTRRLYLVASLPARTRAALVWDGQPAVESASPATPATGHGRTEGARLALKSGLDERAAAARRETSLRQSNSLGSAGQRRMDAKLAVVQAFEIWAAGIALPLGQARIGFALAYNTLHSVIYVPAGVRAALPSVSDRSLERWQGAIRVRGITALAGAYGNRSGASKIDSQPELRDFIIAMLVQFPHARSTHVMQGLLARHSATASIPSIRSLERWIDSWRTANAGTLLAIANPDAWKNKQMVAFGSQSEGIERLNQRWELDSSPADIMCSDGRYSLIGVIDVHARRPMLLVSKTSKAVSVAALVRAALLDWGVPEIAKTDNGADYVGHHITRVFAALDVDHALCPPFQPWHKPHIERFFGTFTRDLAELCAGYIGHNVAERSELEARRSFADRLMTRGAVVEMTMTGEQLQEFCDRWVRDVCMHNAHDGLAGKTPFEVVAQWTGEVRRIADERALDVLLAEAPENNGRRTVQKKGIRLDDAWFIAPELEAWVGRQVQVRFDAIAHDLGTLFVFGGDSLEFICCAECPERTGMDRRDVAAKARERQKVRVQDERRALKAAARREGTDTIVEEILRDRAARAGKLATLPRRSGDVAHTSAGLNAAAAAAAVATAPQRTTAELAHLVDVQQARARIQAEQVPAGQANDISRARAAGGTIPAPTFETVAERMHWLIGQSGYRALSAEEQDSLAAFKRAQPASYRRMAELVAHQTESAKKNDPAGVEGRTGSL